VGAEGAKSLLRHRFLTKDLKRAKSGKATE